MRNSSLGLATFRPAGIAGVGAAKGWGTRVSGVTVPVPVLGPVLYVSADTDTASGENRHADQPMMPRGLLAIRAGTVACAPLSGRNVTDMPLAGCDFEPLVGSNVTLHVVIEGESLLYALHFGERERA